jgi:uncharacterized OsmC-like protein
MKAAAVVPERAHHVTVRLVREYEFVAHFDDLPSAAPLVFDEPSPLGHDRAPCAAAVLGAAAGNCLAASFAFCLRKARLEPTDMTAKVTTHVVKNDRGRYRIRAIDVDITPEFKGGLEAPLDRCTDLFEDFCTVTASLRQGIRVNVNLKEPERPAQRQPQER